MAAEKARTISRKAQGEETRATLLAVASRLFAQKGYDGVSMRTLAAEAGVNLATVGYHFGGKSGLYQAILERIIAVRYEIFPKCEEVLDRFETAGRDLRGKCAVTDWFVDQLVRELLGHSELAWAAFIVSRELAQPSEWFEGLTREFFTPSLNSLCALTEGVLPAGASREDVILTGHCVISMVLKLLEAHTLITRRLGWESYASHLDDLSAIMKKRIRGLLGLPMEDAR
ncbi:CerR family C-terminal domain-containing protein [Pseudodesulfovibrio sp.]|uniref:CerR family C-terminal domain-containing protein n=1 Tax=Pseudodesulfovibrio sp. TaxID=2035812 RepID=UPI002605C64D|nr:CerR family C-terminal domain-containing protein [Pseudodesulfovibrio sp.]MDD3313009.1 CerR family C-terminal domain-containing protein [Pseudodesulfovibrio sp.]